MSYKLEAFILNQSAAKMLPDNLQHLHRCRLDDRLALIPATSQLYQEVVATFGAAEHELDDMFYRLAPALAKLAAEASSVAPVLYLEVDVASGIGERAAIVWHQGGVAYGPTWGSSQVNQALVLFGQLEGLPSDWISGLDVFRYRFTEDWLQHTENSSDQ